MQRSRRTSWMVVGALSVAGLVAGCSSNEVASQGPTSTPSTTTTLKGRTATSSTTTTAEPGQWVPDDLPPCGEMPDPSSGIVGYTTVGSWLPTTIPPGLVLESASTFVETSELSDPSPSPGYRTFLLAEVAGDGRIGQVLRLSRDAPGYYQPGFAQADAEPALDRVRGLPGSIARWINRGDSKGELVAEWNEDGSPWQAAGCGTSIDLGLDGFAAALEPLELSGTEVSDPSGRFVAVGSAPWSSVGGVAGVTLATPDATVFDEPAVRISIGAPHAGAEGLPSLATGQDATYEVVDGRPASFDRSTAITVTDDGSVATATIAGLPGIMLSGRDLVCMLQSLRPVDHDDPALVGLPLEDRSAIHNGRDWATITSDPSLGYCRDW